MKIVVYDDDGRVISEREIHVDNDAPGAEVTPEMIAAGVEAMWGYLDPWEERMREAVVEIYRAMEQARRVLQLGDKVIADQDQLRTRMEAAALHSIRSLLGSDPFEFSAYSPESIAHEVVASVLSCAIPPDP